MDRFTATIMSVVVAALATYFGGNAFFDSSLPIAVALKNALVTMHVRWVFFFVFAGVCYVVLSWIPPAFHRFPRSRQE